MPVVTLRVSEQEKEAWVEEAGGSQKLSEWIRGRCNATPMALIENGRTWVPVAKRGGYQPTASGSPPTKPPPKPERDFHPDFKKPKPKAKTR